MEREEKVKQLFGNSVIEDTVGPSYYDPKVDLVKPSHPSALWYNSGTKRGFEDKKKTPGPG